MKNHFDQRLNKFEIDFEICREKNLDLSYSKYHLVPSTHNIVNEHETISQCYHLFLTIFSRKLKKFCQKFTLRAYKNNPVNVKTDISDSISKLKFR